MRKSAIRPGVTYVGANGKCMSVVGIRMEYRPGIILRDEPGVLYRKEDGLYGRMYLSNFANWARKRYGQR
jgi:hypothetical protein